MAALAVWGMPNGRRGLNLTDAHWVGKRSTSIENMFTLFENVPQRQLFIGTRYIILKLRYNSLLNVFSEINAHIISFVSVESLQSN